MPTPPTHDEILRKTLAVLEECGGNISDAARALGIARQTMQARIDSAARRGIVAPDHPRSAAAAAERIAEIARGPEEDDVVKLRDRVFELETSLRRAKGDELTTEWVKRKIGTLGTGVEEARVPQWAIRAQRGETLPGVPVALWSDWHFGEVVDPAQIGGVNEFDLAIAHERVRVLVEKTIYLLTQHVVNPNYPGIVVNLGGDMVSGDIHDELTATNEQPLMPILLDLYGVLRWALTRLADQFGPVFVACVAGNHGRNTRKPRAKERAFTNFDWLLYQFLARSFADDARFTFYVPDGPDASYSVFGWRYLLTHGDQFRGGDGMIGHFGPVLRGQRKKQARNSAIGRAFDVMLHGHFHTYFPTQAIIGNGSLKGYDEYANMENFAYEPPMQALWLTHPEHGVTLHMPVYLEPRVTHEREDTWVRIR